MSYLVSHYQRGDQLYLLGFSRDAYKKISDDEIFDATRLFEKSLRPEHPPIRFLGLWYTVSSIIVPRADGFFVPCLRQLAFTGV